MSVVCEHALHPRERHAEVPECINPSPPPEFCGNCGARKELHLQGMACPPWGFEKGKFKVTDPKVTYRDPEPSANQRQVGKEDYKEGGYQAAEIQHWDFAASNKLDYFQGQITKYVTRWRKKNGVKDLEKAEHFLQKYIELARAGKV